MKFSRILRRRLRPKLGRGAKGRIDKEGPNQPTNSME
jgi:hypothetical protein